MFVCCFFDFNIVSCSMLLTSDTVGLTNYSHNGSSCVWGTFYSLSFILELVACLGRLIPGGFSASLIPSFLPSAPLMVSQRGRTSEAVVVVLQYISQSTYHHELAKSHPFVHFITEQHHSLTLIIAHESWSSLRAQQQYSTHPLCDRCVW